MMDLVGRGLVAAVIGLVSQAALAADEASTAFEKVTVGRSGEAFEARFATADAIEATDVQVKFIAETVQIEIPHSSFPKGKLLLKADDPTVKSVYTYEPDDSSTRIRLILNKGIAARAFDGFVRVARADGVLTIRLIGSGAKRVDRRKAQQELARVLPIGEDAGVAEAIASVGGQLAEGQRADGKPAAGLGERSGGSEAPVRLVVDAGAVTPESAIALARSDAANGAKGPDSAKDSRSGATPELVKDSAKVDLAAQITSKTRESDIPISIGDKKDKKAESDPLHRALLGVLVLAVALGAGLYGIKRLAKKSSGTKQNAKIQVIGQHFLGPKKSLAIVHVAGESILLGVTEHNITLIKSLALIDDEVPQHLPNHFDGAMESIEGEADDGYGETDDGFVDQRSIVPRATAKVATRADDRRATAKVPTRGSVRPSRDEDDDQDNFDNFAMRGLSEIRDVVSGRLGKRTSR